MIQQQTILRVTDNSGAKTAKCIKVLGGFKRKYAFIGDIIVVSVQNLRNRFKENSKVQKGEVYKAVVLRTKNFRQKNGLKLKFNENAITLLNKRDKIIGSRIIGPVSALSFRKKKFERILFIASKII